MRDRDKRILLLLIIVGVALLPYFMYIKPTKVETETVKNDNVRLEARLEELKKMDAHREDYIKKTEEYDEKMMNIINKFPADVIPENYVMFLLETEIHSMTTDEEGNPYLPKTIYFNTYELLENIDTPIEATDVSTNSATLASIDEVSTGFVAKTNESMLEFKCNYDGFKELLVYLRDFKDPMIYRNLEAAYDKKVGAIVGKIKLAQYAIAGEDRTIDAPKFSFTFDGIEEPFDYNVDNLGIRGNLNVYDETGEIVRPGYGIFGPSDLISEDDEDIAGVSGNDVLGENQVADSENLDNAGETEVNEADESTPVPEDN